MITIKINDRTRARHIKWPHHNHGLLNFIH